MNQDFVFGTEIAPEEVQGAVRTSELGKNGGAHGLNPCLTIWLSYIFSAIVDLESIPPVLRSLSLRHCTRGMDVIHSTQIVTESSLSHVSSPNVLKESFSIGWYYPSLRLGFRTPLRQHTRVVSHSLMLFSTQESLVKFVRDSDSPYLCLNDVEKAFDTIEYTTFLSHLYDLEINGKYWRLIKSWYTNPENVLRHNYVTSHSFDVQRGVRQGSVLSPTLFLVVMSFLLQQLERSGCGLAISGLDIGLCKNMNKHKYTHIHMHIQVHTHACTRTHKHTHTYTTHTHNHTHIITHTYAHTYAHTHTHAHTYISSVGR